MNIRELAREDWALWDAYVRASRAGLPQHLAAWQQVLQRTYGYATHYLAAWEGGRIVGVMPLFWIDSPILGRTLTTLPGGLCADDADVAGALIAVGQELAARRHAKRFTLHDSRHDWPGMGQTTCDHEHWLVDVSRGQEATWSALDRNIRRQVRMAERNDLIAVVDRSGARLDDFYGVLSKFTHQAGTPLFARRFLAEVIAAFPDGFNIVVVYHAGQAIGGYFQLELAGTNYGVWGAALHEFLELRPVYLAYWTILADSASRGFTTLDMGRSPSGSSASSYKGQWATSRAPVYQQSWSPGGQATFGVARQVQSDAKLQWVRRWWPKLPQGVAQVAGPLLRRHIPFA